MADYETLEVDVRDDEIAVVTFTRPDKLNALDGQALDDLKHAAESLSDHDSVRTVLLEGEGRAFIAGADIEAMLEMSREEGEAFCRRGHETMNALEDIPVPVLAAVDGFALGGGLEVALACDLIYASERAQFGLPEVSLGIIPGFGGTQRLARFVGWQRARELVFTGRKIDADRAEAIGLVANCYEVDSFDQRVEDLADTIADRAPLAVRSAKQVMQDGQDVPLEEGLDGEREAFGELFETEDRLEGMRAFTGRRDADFQGE